MVSKDDLPEEFKSLLDKLGSQLGSDSQENMEKFKSLAEGAKTSFIFGILLERDGNVMPVSLEIFDNFNGLVEFLKIVTMFAISSIANNGSVKEGLGGVAASAFVTAIDALSLALDLDAPLNLSDSLNGMKNNMET